MEEHGVVPEIIDKLPEHSIQISYGDLTVNLGNELTPTQVQDKPTRMSWPHKEGSYYTLLMIDPDAPSRQDQSLGQVRHWLVVNIPGNDVSKGDTLTEYVGSGPREGSGLHRYIFFVYLQKWGKVTLNADMRALAQQNRLNFNSRNFVQKYGLADPIAGNFYQAQYDDYVPILHAKLAEQMKRNN